MPTFYVPVMHCEKRAVTDMLFRQSAVIEFLVKDGHLAGVTSRCVWKRLHGCYSVRRWVKHFKDGNTDIADQPRCGRPRTAATERNNQKVDEFVRKNRRITVRETAARLGVGHHGVQEMKEILGSLNSPFATGTEKQNGWEPSPIYPEVRI
jgi:hypothetical protein